MTAELTGIDALDALNGEGGNGGQRNEFNSFSSGTTYKVKVLGTADLMMYYGYSVFKKVNTFVAKNPSKKTKNGYPVDDLTSWDKAYLYHKEQSKDFSDAHGQEASKYRPKQRFAFGFYDLTSGELIVVDLTKNQGQAIYKTIKKYEKKLDKMAFELSKDGQSTSTTVSLSPIIDLDEDLTDKERANFEKAPKEFDKARFDGILFEYDEDEMVQKLIEAGFDVSLIGLEKPEAKAEGTGGGTTTEATDLEDEEFPF